jgi:hypothetical protein
LLTYYLKEKTLFALAQGSMMNLATYQAYDINGYTFCTKPRDQKGMYQNSGVTMESLTGKVKDRYYSRLEEIWELDYTKTKIPMFRVRWAKSTEFKNYFTTMAIPKAKLIGEVTVKAITYHIEQLVLAKKVAQCFYIIDPIRQSRLVKRIAK